MRIVVSHYCPSTRHMRIPTHCNDPRQAGTRSKNSGKCSLADVRGVRKTPSQGFGVGVGFGSKKNVRAEEMGSGKCERGKWAGSHRDDENKQLRKDLHIEGRSLGRRSVVFGCAGISSRRQNGAES